MCTTAYTLDRLRQDMAEHHDHLEQAISRYGFGQGKLTPREFWTLRLELTARAASSLHYLNPYAREIWERHLRCAIKVRGLHTGPLYMATILDQRWHFPWSRWSFVPEVIELQAEQALAGVSYLLLIELAPLTYAGERLVAPHLQGFIFQALSRRQKQKIAAQFAGGLTRATPLLVQEVCDFVGASRYNVKPPDRMGVCFTARTGRRRRRGRPLRHIEHHFLWRNLRHYTYPQLTLAGGEGENVLRLAMQEAGYDVP